MQKRKLLPMVCFFFFTGIQAQKPHLHIGIGGNFELEEPIGTNTIGSAAVFAEVGLPILTQTELRYAVEGGAKFEGKVINTSLPPQKYGNNYLLNQYLKAIRYVGNTTLALKPYVGLGYVLNHQRPYTTRLDENDVILSTERLNNWNHGGSAYLGLVVSKFSLEGSYHIVSNYPDFAALKLGYRMF